MRPHTITPQIVAALLLALCPRCYAPIHGGFPGVPELLAKSDAIVVATISEKLSEPDFGASAYYKIYRERTLKGDVGETLSVQMRQLEVSTPAQEGQKGVWLAGADALSFSVGSRYVLFLSKAKDDAKASFENVNCDGSSFEVSPWLKLDSLNGKSLRDALRILLLDYRDYSRARLKHIEQRTEEYLRGL